MTWKPRRTKPRSLETMTNDEIRMTKLREEATNGRNSHEQDDASIQRLLFVRIRAIRGHHSSASPTPPEPSSAMNLFRHSSFEFRHCFEASRFRSSSFGNRIVLRISGYFAANAGVAQSRIGFNLASSFAASSPAIFFFVSASTRPSSTTNSANRSAMISLG